MSCKKGSINNILLVFGISKTIPHYTLITFTFKLIFKLKLPCCLKNRSTSNKIKLNTFYFNRYLNII